MLWVRAKPLRLALVGAGLAMWTWVLGEKIYWTGDEPSSDRTDYFAGVRLAPAPTTVWGFTVERQRGNDRGEGGTRSRVLANRADGIAEIALAARPRSYKVAMTQAAETVAELIRLSTEDIGDL